MDDGSLGCGLGNGGGAGWARAEAVGMKGKREDFMKEVSALGLETMQN